LKETPPVIECRTDTIEVKHLPIQKSNSFLIIGTTHSNPLPSIFGRLLFSLSQFPDEVKYLLEMLIGGLKNNPETSLTWRSANQFIRNFKASEFKFDTESQIELKTAMKQITEIFEKTPIIIEFSNMVIRLFSFNQFSILIKDESTPEKMKEFRDFTEQLEALKGYEQKRFRFKLQKHAPKKPRTSYSQHRQKRLLTANKRCYYKEDVAQAIYPHKKIKVEKGVQRSIVQPRTAKHKEVPLVNLSATAQINLIQDDLLNDCFKTSKWGVPKKIRRPRTNKRKFSNIRRDTVRDLYSPDMKTTPIRDLIAKLGLGMPEFSTSFAVSSPNESFTTSHIELQPRHSPPSQSTSFITIDSTFCMFNPPVKPLLSKYPPSSLSSTPISSLQAPALRLIAHPAKIYVHKLK
jgi:hypothetical protein